MATFSFTVIGNVAMTIQKFVTKVETKFGNAVSKQNRLLKRFSDQKITLILHWHSDLLKQLYNLDLKFKENWSKKERTIKKSFLGTIVKVIVLLGTKVLFIKVLTHWSIKLAV